MVQAQVEAMKTWMKMKEKENNPSPFVTEGKEEKKKEQLELGMINDNNVTDTVIDPRLQRLLPTTPTVIVTPPSDNEKEEEEQNEKVRKEQQNTLFEEIEMQANKIKSMEGIMDDSDYHLRKFSDPSTDESASPFLIPPKIPTIKDRVIGILTSPNRQLKKDLERRDIFMITYLLARYLNCRAALETYHLSSRSVFLIKSSWMSILPYSFMKYIHEEENIVLFSPHSSSTFKKRCIILKQYFDGHLK